MFLTLIIYENRWNIFCSVHKALSLIKIYVISVYLAFFFERERKGIIKLWLKTFLAKRAIRKKCLIMSICVHLPVCLMLSVFPVPFVTCHAYLSTEIFFAPVGFLLSIYQSPRNWKRSIMFILVNTSFV